VARVNLASGPVWLLEPMTFMNRSGQAVAPLMRFFKIAPQELLVVHDELDVMPGLAKFKQGGGSGGHNGLKDIQAQLGTPDFWRLRLGIGHPGVKAEVVDYVLRKPAPEQREALHKSIEQSLGAAEDFIAGRMEQALQKVHAGAPRPKPPRPPRPPGSPGSPKPATPASTPSPSLSSPPSPQEPTA
jgi:peptidyl-tRNA hydrolase, PTH1 family